MQVVALEDKINQLAPAKADMVELASQIQQMVSDLQQATSASAVPASAIERNRLVLLGEEGWLFMAYSVRPLRSPFRRRSVAGEYGPGDLTCHCQPH